MARFDDVATNQDMTNIANAIRAVTRTTEGMTISQMPERLWNIRVVQTSVKEITTVAATNSLELGIFDGNIRHLFIVTPLTNADAVILAKAKTNLQLEITALVGDNQNRVEVYLNTEKDIPAETDISLRILDLLLPIEEETAGFVVNAVAGGAGKSEPYNEDASYEVGDTFLLNGNLGITTQTHDAESFNPQHNEMLANQIWDDNSNSYIDLADIALIVAGKLDASAVVNERTDSESEVYSTKYVNSSFAPLAFVQPYYATRVDDVTANLTKQAPTPAAENILTNTKSNTDYDWSSPEFEFTLQLETGVVITNTNAIELELAFKVSDPATVSWGSKILVSTDDGATWTAISTAHAYGAETYEANVGNKIKLNALFDLLQGLTTYPAGTKIKVQLFKKQSATITTTIHCGVTIDGAVINTLAQMIVANVVIDTAQLKDGSVTYSKLAQDVKTILAGKQDNLTAGENITIQNNVISASEKVDGTTISKNASNQLRAIGLTDGENSISYADIVEALTIERSEA